MESLNDFFVSIRKYVLDDLGVNALINNRFYGHHISTLTNPVFPACTFEILAGIPSAAGITEDFEMNITAYSEISYDEASDVYTKVMQRLKNAIIPTRISVYAQRTPITFYDPTGRLFTVVGRVRVVRIP